MTLAKSKSKSNAIAILVDARTRVFDQLMGQVARGDKKPSASEGWDCIQGAISHLQKAESA